MYRSTSAEEMPAPTPSGPAPTIMEAIVKTRCVNATYNRDKVVLAPHILYLRHGQMYVDAITVARNGMLPREEKLGTFKLDGLGDIRLTGRDFAPSEKFEPAAERYENAALLKVESATAA